MLSRVPKSLQPESDGLQPTSDGLQPTSDGLQPSSDGLQPRKNSQGQGDSQNGCVSHKHIFFLILSGVLENLRRPDAEGWLCTGGADQLVDQLANQLVLLVAGHPSHTLIALVGWPGPTFVALLCAHSLLCHEQSALTIWSRNDKGVLLCRPD